MNYNATSINSTSNSSSSSSASSRNQPLQRSGEGARRGLLLSTRSILGVCVFGAIIFSFKGELNMAQQASVMMGEQQQPGKWDNPNNKGATTATTTSDDPNYAPTTPPTQDKSSNSRVSEATMNIFGDMDHEGPPAWATSPLIPEKGPLFLEHAKSSSSSSDFNNTVCGRLDLIPSFPEVIRLLQPLIVDTTLQHVMENVYSNKYVGKHDGQQISNLVKQAIATLLDMWDNHRVRKTFVHPMPTETIRKLVHIIDDRLLDPTTHPPLQIMIYGGVVAEGNSGADRFDLHGSTTVLTGDSHQARFSTQVEVLFNELLFPHVPGKVIEVTNMAADGMTSDIGASMIESAMWPDGYVQQGPDLIIASFAKTDVLAFLDPSVDDAINHQAVFQSLTQFIKGAYGNRCDKLPAVIIVDDTFLIDVDNLTIRDNLLNSRVVADVSAWYEIMTVSYTRAFMHDFLRDQTITHETSPVREKMFGSTLKNIQPALLYHTGIAWLLFFPFLRTMHDFCADMAAGWDDIIREEALATGKDTGPADGLEVRYIPPLLTTTRLETNPANWRQHHDSFEANCASPDYQPGNTCAHNWMVHKVMNVTNKEQVKNMVESVTSFNTGWMASYKDGEDRMASSSHGSAVTPAIPRPGWVAQKQNASFGIQVKAVDRPIRKISIHYIKSFGDKWRDSKLQVQLLIPNVTTPTVESNDWDIANVDSENATSLDNNETPTIEADLYALHVNFNTTIQTFISFAVDVPVGSHINATFTLTEGSMFKITGMMFCSNLGNATTYAFHKEPGKGPEAVPIPPPVEETRRAKRRRRRKQKKLASN